MINDPHGEFKVYTTEERIVLELNGEFNLQGVQSANSGVKQKVNELSRESWSLLIKLPSHTLLTHDSFEEVSSFFVWCKANGCQHVIYLVNSNIHLTIIEELLKESGLSFTVKFLTSTEEQ